MDRKILVVERDDEGRIWVSRPTPEGMAKIVAGEQDSSEGVWESWQLVNPDNAPLYDEFIIEANAEIDRGHDAQEIEVADAERNS